MKEGYTINFISNLYACPIFIVGYKDPPGKRLNTFSLIFDWLFAPPLLNLVVHD